MEKENDFWLIDSNSVGVIRFYKKKDKILEDMFIEEDILMGSHGENPPLMKTRRKMKIDDARFFWVDLLNQ